MPLAPKFSDAPRIRGALRLYKVSSFITGVFLLLLVLMMVFRYGLGVDIEMGGPEGFLALQQKDLITGINLSTAILVVHGWFYVLYIFADFRVWSLLRWPFSRFLLIALGGVIPFLSFIAEHFYHRLGLRELAALETSEPITQPAAQPAAQTGATIETVEASNEQ